MKLFVRMVIGCALLGNLAMMVFSSVDAQYGRRGRHGSDPLDILDNVAADANEEYRIQDTQLNDVSNLRGGYASEYRIANTLDDIRTNIDPYLQWAIYIGLATATILLIYNGILLVTSWLHNAGERWKVATRVQSILFGVMVITGFYLIIRLISALINIIATG